MRIHAMFFLFGLVVASSSCEAPQKVSSPSLKYHVEIAEDWNQLFIRNQGWFGGDGIFAIPISLEDSTKQLIIFSDTMLGLIKEGVLQKGYHMVNNSVVYLDGNNPVDSDKSFPIPVDSMGKDRSIFPAKLEGGEESEYFWLGDGLLHPISQDVHIFAYRVADRPELTGQFKFEVLGGAIITLPAGSTFPYNDQIQTRLPFFENNDGWITSFGAGILERGDLINQTDDGYIYVYGIRDPNKQVLVARVKAEDFLVFDQWRFLSNDQWVADFTQSTAVADSTSNELSVSQLSNGQYAMIFQVQGIYPKVAMRLADSPSGPFGNMIELWDCSDALEEPEFFTYNAKAHPTLSGPNELLISYNVNSFAFWNQIEKYPHLYRPRFIKLVFE
ncbi:MAG: DUF4185 domain-containing protein [Saprospiraceae bacterium]|nr:DUF4185 domain-containing protein [Saprospiraceae bacterium]